MSVTGALGVICTVLAIVFIWPQVFRVYRLRSVEGIAPKGTLQGVVGGCLWTEYALARWNLALFVSNLTVALAFALIGIAQVRHRAMPARWLVGTIGIALAIGGALSAIHPAALGWVAIAISGTSVVPQTVHVLRADSLRGVSPVMYSLLVLTAVCWCTYGILMHDLVISAPNVIVGPCAAVVAVKAIAARRHTGLVQ